MLATVSTWLLGAPASSFAAADPDPWQSMNRSIFAFNDTVDRWFLEPVAKAYDWALPSGVQSMVGNFTTNLATPAVLMNDLLQGKPHEAVEDLTRMALNSTFGMAGLIDVAGAGGVRENDEDLGQTLGVWGVPAGPYLVLPFLGPSSPRDAVGQVGDAAATVHGYFLGTPLSVGIRAVELVNLRASLLDDVRDAREASFDYYVFVRNAYVQYRLGQVADGVAPAPGPNPVGGAEAPPLDEDDLYFFDDEASGDEDAN